VRGQRPLPLLQRQKTSLHPPPLTLLPAERARGWTSTLLLLLLLLLLLPLGAPLRRRL
jgi:hypothetical protein